MSSDTSTATPLSGSAGKPVAGGGPAARGVRASAIADAVGRWAVIGGFGAMLIVFSLLNSSAFLDAGTLKNILDQSAVPIILVCGLTFVLVVGEFDLSYAATLGLCAGLTIALMTKSGLAMGLAIGVTVLASCVVGLLVGSLVTVGRASSFIVTLAIGAAVTGLELAITDNKTIYEGIPAGYADLASATVLGLHTPVWLALVIFAGAVVLLHGTKFGRHAHAVGGNATAAFLAGVRVRQVRMLCFLLVAVLAGISAMVLTSRASSYYPNAAGGFLLNTYAAAFLGAAAGRKAGFTVAGSALGVLWITVLQTGLTLNNAPAWTSSFIQGLVLAAAVLIASRGRRTAV